MNYDLSYYAGTKTVIITMESKKKKDIKNSIHPLNKIRYVSLLLATLTSLNFIT